MINYKLDLALLKAFTNRHIYDKYCAYVNKNMLSDVGKTILNGYHKYFEQFSDVKQIDYSHFSSWFYSTLHANWLSSDQEYYNQVFSQILQTDDKNINELLNLLNYRFVGSQIVNIMGLNELLKGKDCYIQPFDTYQLEEIIKEFNTKLEKEDDRYTHDFNNIFTSKGEYLKSRLNGLNDITGGYYKYNSTLVIAGYDGGKTAFAISEATYIAKGLNDEERILYFNNEQSNNAIRQRIIAALLNEKNIEFKNFREFVQENKEQCEQLYKERGGNKIELFDVWGKDLNYIKQQCKLYNPKLIIIDQVDNIIPGKIKEKHPQPYDAMYSAIRKEIAQVYAPVICFTQAKNGGKIYKEGGEVYKEWVGSSDAHWSNVDKQAHVDVIIGIGVSNYIPNQRNFLIDRNKDGKLGKFSAMLRKDSSRFEE